MAKYEIRDVVCDYGIYEDGELKLILNSRSNAEYIKAILEVDGSRPNAATIYSPKVEAMSDEECMAVFRLCCAEENHCKACPLNNLGDGCFLHIDRRVMDIVERNLKQKASSGRCDCEKQREEGVSEDDEKKQIEEMAKDISYSIVWCDEVVPAVNCLGTAAALYDKNYRKQEWISVDERLPDDGETVLTISSDSEIEVSFYDSDHKGIFQQFGGLVHIFNITHWMPLPDRPKMKGETK